MTERFATGTVVAFDERRGLGTVAAEDGRSLSFHTVAITDGSRRIGSGTRVRFVVGPGHLGEWEATHLESLA